MRLAWVLRALRAAINKRPHTIAAKATDAIARLRALRRFGGGTEVAVSAGGEVAAGLLAMSADAAGGGCDSFATGAGTGAAAGWLLAATSAGSAAAAGGGTVAGCGVSATAGVVGGVVAIWTGGGFSAVVAGSGARVTTGGASSATLVATGAVFSGTSLCVFLPSKIIGGAVSGGAGFGAACGSTGFGAGGRGTVGISIGQGPRFTVLVVKFPPFAWSTVIIGIPAFFCCR